MNLYNFSEQEIVLFGLVFLRLSAFVVSWPIFGSIQMAPQMKVLLALILTLIVFPLQRFTPGQVEMAMSNILIVGVKEVFLGLCTGYLARFFFFAFQIAGELISASMGLTSAQVFNPTLGSNSTAVENFYVTIASMFFLAVNGHHYLLSGLIDSLQWMPPGTLGLQTQTFIGIGPMVQEISEIGLKLSAPVVISILVINLVLGVIGKTVPQMNVLVTSFPVNIFVGLALLIVTMPLFVDQMGEFLVVSSAQVFLFLRGF